MPWAPKTFRLRSKQDVKRDYERNYKRPEYHAWYGTARWKKARVVFLTNNPWCAECLAAGRYTEANEIDHTIPHKGDAVLFWDIDNWAATCTSCHSRKTMTEIRKRQNEARKGR